VISIILLILCLITISFTLSIHDGNYAIQFKEFIQRYGKKYSTPEEFRLRYSIFAKNLMKIDKLNRIEAGNKIHGITKFADLTKEEFKNRYLMKNIAKEKAAYINSIKYPTEIPTTFDWRELGAVTPIYDQGECGSPWAFTATETIESAWFIANHSLESFSAQQVVSCDRSSDGCNGGCVPYAFDYIKRVGGLELTSSYPYTSSNGTDGRCKFNDSLVIGKYSNYSVVTQSPSYNETAMLAAVSSIGPVSVNVDAEDWESYSGGIMRKCSNSSVDHTAVIVGYNTSNGIDYWIVRNSWGTDWGISGYIYIERHHNLCDINSFVIYPIVP